MGIKEFKMVRTIPIIILLLLVFTGCFISDPHSDKEIPEIVPTKFEPIELGENGVTVQQMSDYSQQQIDRIKRNTLNHKIPFVGVLNSNNKMVDLLDLIKKPTFILAMDTDCGIGRMYARENFPMALKRPEVDRSRFDVIFLISTYRDQTFKSDEVIEFQKEMEAIYDNVYLISEENAIKMNATGVTTILTDNKGVVKDYRKGTAMNSEDQIKVFDYMLSLIKV